MTNRTTGPRSFGTEKKSRFILKQSVGLRKQITLILALGRTIVKGLIGLSAQCGLLVQIQTDKVF